MQGQSSRAHEVGKTAWRILKTGSLAAADTIITLSLMRKGARPKPGTRTAWPKCRRPRLYKDQKGLCIYCRCRLNFGASHIDHIISVNQGGTNDLDNTQLLCAGCNLKKSDQNDKEFRGRYKSLIPQERGRIPDRAIKQSQFRAVTRATSDSQSYKRFKAGEYLTSTQKVTSGALATAAVTALVIFLPINQATTPEDASALLVASVATGAAAGLGVRLSPNPPNDGVWEVC
jgi:5-methylcytosine-specific restriction endonuclease McrA